ncbi:hypothetical protein [Pseudonocardia sp.]
MLATVAMVRRSRHLGSLVMLRNARQRPVHGSAGSGVSRASGQVESSG